MRQHFNQIVTLPTGLFPEIHLTQYTIWIIVCFALFWGILGFANLGHRMGRRRLLATPEAADAGTGNVDAMILSLLGLLIAFTFSSAYSRFEMRRQLIIEEANDIGTAWLRLDLLPANSQQGVRTLFHDYVKQRSEIWSLLSDREATYRATQQTSDIQQQLWSAVVMATADETTGDARKLLLPALNQMFDISTTRLMAVLAHPPAIIFILLTVLSLAAAWLTGFGMSKSPTISLTHLIGFSTLGCAALFVIVDLEYPRFGLVTLDGPHQLLEDLARQTEIGIHEIP